MKKLLLVVLLTAVATGCAKPVLVQDVIDQPIVRFDDAPLTVHDVERAIVLGGMEHGWKIAPVAPGHMVGTLVVRGKHEAVVDITYDTHTYSVTYKDSTNLDYRPPRFIHKNYNRWVAYLVRSINSNIQRVE